MQARARHVEQGGHPCRCVPPPPQVAQQLEHPADEFALGTLTRPSLVARFLRGPRPQPRLEPLDVRRFVAARLRGCARALPRTTSSGKTSADFLAHLRRLQFQLQLFQFVLQRLHAPLRIRQRVFARTTGRTWFEALECAAERAVAQLAIGALRKPQHRGPLLASEVTAGHFQNHAQSFLRVLRCVSLSTCSTPLPGRPFS